MNTSESVLSKIADPHAYPLIFETGDIQKNAHGPYARMLVNPPRHADGIIWIGYADGRGVAIKRPQ